MMLDDIREQVLTLDKKIDTNRSSLDALEVEKTILVRQLKKWGDDEEGA